MPGSVLTSSRQSPELGVRRPGFPPSVGSVTRTPLPLPNGGNQTPMLALSAWTLFLASLLVSCPRALLRPCSQPGWLSSAPGTKPQPSGPAALPGRAFPLLLSQPHHVSMCTQFSFRAHLFYMFLLSLNTSGIFVHVAACLRAAWCSVACMSWGYMSGPPLSCTGRQLQGPAHWCPRFAQSRPLRAVLACTWDLARIRVRLSRQIRRRLPLQSQFVTQSSHQEGAGHGTEGHAGEHQAWSLGGRSEGEAWVGAFIVVSMGMDRAG